MANYAYTLGKNVLLVTPGKKAKDELVKRCKTVFGLDIPSSDGRIDCIITSGLLNRNDIKDPERRKDFESDLSKYEWVLADEVEYTINDSGDYLYSCLVGATNLYGFSGTADKKGAELISFANGLSDVVIRNKGLIKYFGPSLVYRMPQGMKIDDITIKTKALDAVVFDDSDFDKDNNTYLSGITKIWTTPEVCDLVVRIINRFPKLFIPINNLINILNVWIENYWKGKFRVLLVCGEGYVYYDLSGNKTNLTLAEACEYIRNGQVDVIPSTSSGYRALDFPNLENILLVEGLVAGVVLQSIGRVARGTHMNILSLRSASGKWIPLYSKGDKTRKEMFRNYYKYCDLTETVITEQSL